MRYLIDVIDDILLNIPDDTEEFIKLRKNIVEKFNFLISNNPYFPPEATPFLWKELFSILTCFLGRHDTEWKRKIHEIVVDSGSCVI